MLSRDVAPALRTRLRDIRTARGLSQQDLAERCGLTRQSVGAIECGRYVPNTAVSLALARALGCRVEDLFTLPDAPTSVPVELAEARTPTRRVAVAAVRGRLVAHPLVAERELLAGFPSADAILDSGTVRPRASLLAPPRELEKTALVLGCDPGLAVLRAHVERRNPDVRLRCISSASRRALSQLAAGHTHVAGTHLRDPATGVHNLAQAKRAMAKTGGLLVRFASWEQGLVVAAGNPRRVRGVADLARPRIRFVNRECGAGVRALLDELLAAEGIAACDVPGYEREVATHVAAAACVASDGADVALSLRATAEAFDLGFVPLAAADFDLAIPADQTSHPAVATLLDLLNDEMLRRDLGGITGYDVTRTGSIVAELAAAGLLERNRREDQCEERSQGTRQEGESRRRELRGRDRSGARHRAGVGDHEEQREEPPAEEGQEGLRRRQGVERDGRDGLSATRPRPSRTRQPVGSLQHAHVRQVAVQLRRVEAVADDEDVRDREAEVVDRDRRHGARRLVQQRAQLDGARSARSGRALASAAAHLARRRVGAQRLRRGLRPARVSVSARRVGLRRRDGGTADVWSHVVARPLTSIRPA
jgi:molybdate-binding protein/DNA-binding XRE family transcriptional regulator